MKGIRVLSMFDGISCGQQSLDRNGVPVETYYASEIDKWAIGITQHNYPNTIQIGDVMDVDPSEFGEIDLIMFGSPCQNLSISVVNNIDHNQGLEGEKSKLFYVGYEILKKVKPKYFLYENVASMKNKDRDIITEALGVEPIMIDSNLVTAQDRKRYYWTNIPMESMPTDLGIMLGDIIIDKDAVDSKYWYEQDHTYHGDDKKIQATLHVKGHDILKRVYNQNNKCGTLTCCRGGHKQKKVYQDGRVRKLTPLEYEKLQGIHQGYTELGVIDGKVKKISDSQRYNCLGNCWTVPIIAHILSFADFSK